MDFLCYQKLDAIRGKYGPSRFGKIVQKVLALTFRELGHGRIVEREVQGVDVDVAGRWAIEVKTTAQDAVVLEDKDVMGLRDRARDGYEPVLAVLRMSPLSDWLLARANSLRARTYRVDDLRAYSIGDVERKIQGLFPSVVEQVADRVLKDGWTILDERLRSKGIDVQTQQTDLGPGTQS